MSFILWGIRNGISFWLTVASLVIACETTKVMADESAKPRGIYLLGRNNTPVGGFNPRQTATAMDKTYTDGATLRFNWATVHLSVDGYDWSVIDDSIQWMIEQGHENKQISLEPLAGDVPSWVNTRAEWCVDAGGEGIVRTAVPWDAQAHTQYRNFFNALASHTYQDPNAGSAQTPLRDHSMISIVAAQIPGLGGIRWRDTARNQGRGCDQSVVPYYDNLNDVAGYNRAFFVNETTESFDTVAEAFPTKFRFVSVFDLEDDQGDVADILLDHLRDNYGWGTITPTFGIFRENAACYIPVDGGILSREKDNTYNLLQALGSWNDRDPGQDDDAFLDCMDPGDPTASETGPDIGIYHNYEFNGTRFFEFYLNDLSDTELSFGLDDAHKLITADDSELVTVELYSVPANDGYIHGTFGDSGIRAVAEDSDQNALRVGRVTQRHTMAQIHFEVGTIPSSAEAVKAKILLTRGSGSGNSPLETGNAGDVLVDSRVNFFGAETAPRSGDYQAATTETDVVSGGLQHDDNSAWGWLNHRGRASMDQAISAPSRRIQFRIRTEQNGSGDNNYDGFYSGEHGGANRPKLQVTYYCPGGCSIPPTASE